MRLDYKGKHLFAFSDTHGMHRDLSIPENTDILICAGDVVSDFQENGLSDFFDWFSPVQHSSDYLCRATMKSFSTFIHSKRNREYSIHASRG